MTAVVKNGNNMREKRLSSKGDSDWVVAGIVLSVIQVLLFVVYYFETDFDLTDFSSKPNSKRFKLLYFSMYNFSSEQDPRLLMPN